MDLGDGKGVGPATFAGAELRASDVLARASGARFPSAVQVAAATRLS